MTLLVIEGFEALSGPDLQKKYSPDSNADLIRAATGGRRGGAGLTTSANGSGLIIPLGTNASTLIIGLAVKAGMSVNGPLLQLRDGTTIQIALSYISNFGLRITRSTTTTLASTTEFILPPASFVYIEMKAVFHNTAGSIEIRVNGVTVLSYSGDTTSTANAYANRLDITATSSNFMLDDLYVCDGTGTANNDFLGDMRVDTLLPTADGTYSAFTPSTGTSHYAAVDDMPLDTADYVSGTTVGSRDSYVMSDLAMLPGSDIAGVAVFGVFAKDDNGIKNATTMLRSGGTNYDGVTFPLSATAKCLGKIYEKNPNGDVAWTESAVNGLEAGAVVV